MILVGYRYCINCKEVKKFILNKALNHSECECCGSRFAIKDMDEIRKMINKRYDKIIKNAKKWLQQQKSLMGTIK